MNPILVPGKNIVVWAAGTTSLEKYPLINPQTVASISRWDDATKEVKYIPGGKNPANFTNLVRNLIYLFEVKQEFKLSGAVLILAVPSIPSVIPSPPDPTPLPSGKRTMDYTREKSFSVGNNVGMQFSFPPAFANAWKTARSEWLQASWTGNSVELGNKSIPLDDKGNPKADGYNIVWEGGDGNQGTGMLIFEGKARVIEQFGYLLFPDFGNTNMLLPGQGYDAATNTTKARCQIQQGYQNLTVIFVETQATPSSPKNSGIRNPRLLRPTTQGGSTPHKDTEVFNRAYLPSVAPFDHIRFMAGTNWNQQVNWSDRTYPWENQTKYLKNESNFERNGTALEYNILLCNQTGKDFWLNIPHLATDQWIENAVLLILYGSDGTNPYKSLQANPVYPPLDPVLKCYVEFSNEVWNFAYQQAHDLVKICHQLVDAGNSPLNFDGQDNEIFWVWRYAMMRTVEASRLFRKHAGDAAMGSRIRPLYFFQYSNYNDTASEAFRFLLDYYGDVGDLWGAGGAAYFQSNNDAATTIDGIFNSGIPRDENTEWIQVESYWAHLHGLNYCTYEGGFGVGGDGATGVSAKSYWDSRAKVAQRKSIDTFAASDGYMYTCGTYAVYKSIYEVDSSPLIGAVKEFIASSSPPALALPKTVTVPGSITADEGGDGIARHYQDGSRLNRLLIAPMDGDYTLTLNYSGTEASIRVFVNGFPIALTSLSSASSATNSETFLIALRKGVNGLIVIVQVKKGDMTFDKINVTKS